VRSLRRDGHEVKVWNRTAARALELADCGAVPAGTVREAVAGADVVLTILFDAGATLDIKDEIVAGLGPDAIWIQAATVGVAGIDRLADGVAALVDAPVIGTRKPAEDGTLTVLASGDPALLARCAPVFEAIGSRTVVAGDRIGHATALKLACNAWTALLTLGAGQSLEFARRLGIDPRLFLEAIAGSAVSAPLALGKGEAMLSGDFTTSFAVDGVVKDIGLMLSAAEQTGFRPDLLATAYDLFSQASEEGHGADDMAAVAVVFRQ
jgi:3-hydroxyisobutyrate dehydrogenase